MDDDSDPLPFDVSKLLKQFTDNVSISRDDEGVIITFKSLAPGTDLGAIRRVMENAMRANNSDMMRRFMSAFTGEPDDEESDEEDMDDEDGFMDASDDEDLDEDGEDGPGFRIEDLDGGNGFKLVPDDADDVDGLLDSLSQVFDPDFFASMMQAFSQVFGMQPPVEDERDAGTPPDKKRKQGDSNTTAGNFYI